MNGLTHELQRLRDENPDVALILDTFAGVESVYQHALGAMGLLNQVTFEVSNTAEVTFSSQPESSACAHNQ